MSIEPTSQGERLVPAPRKQPVPPPRNAWPAPSPRIRELLRQGAERVQNAPPEWILEIDEASIVPESDASHDPVLIAATKRANRAGIAHWAAANVEHPGARVAAFISADVVNNAREFVRRGEVDVMLAAVRWIQAAAWQRWMHVAFELTADPTELKELLEVSARSISAFNDDNAEGLSKIMKAEQEARTLGTHVDRRETVVRILEGGKVDPRLADQRLGYDLHQDHCAAVIWSEEPEVDIAHLERAAEALAEHSGTRRRLVVIANAATAWTWVHGGTPVDLHALASRLKSWPEVRMAIGPGSGGIDGFRRTHLDALAAQHLVARLRTRRQVVHFDDVRLVSLMGNDLEAMQQFIAHTLGDLANGPAVLRKTLLTFLRAGGSAAQSALLLHAHRNTLQRRLERAVELLPRPIEANRLHVAAALEALSWTEGTDAER